MFALFLSPLVFITVLLKVAKVHAQGDASSACGNVLQQGVYNVLSSSKSTSTYAQFQSAMCSMSSTMTYSEYLNAGSNSQSSSSYFAWNAAASFMGIGASGGNSGGQSQLSQSEFTQFQSAAASYQESYCGSSSASSGSSDLFNSYMRTISPEVFSAYQSCLSLYSTGIHFSSQYGWGSDSSFINIEFSSDTYGARAEINGIVIVPQGSASCIFFGDKGPTDRFSASLFPDKTYTVACKSNHNATVDVMTIAISTTQGIYMTYLYNQPPATLLSQLQAQVTQLQARIESLETNKDVGSYKDVTSYAPRAITARNTVTSLSPAPITVTIEQTGVYLVTFSGRLWSLASTDLWWSVHLYHQSCSCSYSVAFGTGYIAADLGFGEGDGNSGNSWIGSLSAGDVLELKFFVRVGGSSPTSGPAVNSGDSNGVNSIQAVFLRPSSDSSCNYCLPPPVM
jgi:hypothetical protein